MLFRSVCECMCVHACVCVCVRACVCVCVCVSLSVSFRVFARLFCVALWLLVCDELECSSETVCTPTCAFVHTRQFQICKIEFSRALTVLSFHCHIKISRGHLQKKSCQGSKYQWKSHRRLKAVGQSVCLHHPVSCFLCLAIAP